ncbi:MAG: hypothetical protein PF693_14445 [Spirochaetia bacterium]|jgi:hypothetical protein|nr:hypothetical protein [Spirochaetia bacterium]
MEWKELKKDNLPPDILTGNYEFEFEGHSEWIKSDYNKAHNLLADIMNGVHIERIYRYRRPEPKQPSHEEIMTKWWQLEKGQDYQRVTFYHPDGIYVFIMASTSIHVILQKFKKRDFISLESADIPPCKEEK